jgi:hypothetical protein
MEGWKVIKYGNQKQAGPANAIDEVAKSLEEKNIPYVIEDFETKTVVKRKSRKTVNNLELEVRNEDL